MTNNQSVNANWLPLSSLGQASNHDRPSVQPSLTRQWHNLSEPNHSSDSTIYSRNILGLQIDPWRLFLRLSRIIKLSLTHDSIHLSISLHFLKRTLLCSFFSEKPSSLREAAAGQNHGFLTL